MRVRGVAGSGKIKQNIEKYISSSMNLNLTSNYSQQQHLSMSPLFDAYIILDFEATCERERKIPNQEIIEFPMIIINAHNGNILKEFQRYVKPVINPILSKFCTELTGITQNIVDKAETFPLVLNSAINFIHENGFGESPPMQSYLFITCGDWDLRTMLPNQLNIISNKNEILSNIPLTFNRWCNIKQFMRNITLPYPKKIIDLPDMMLALGLTMKGRHHSGIDDCRNITSIVQKLIYDGYIIKPTTDKSGLQQWVVTSNKESETCVNMLNIGNNSFKSERGGRGRDRELSEEKEKVLNRPQVNILSEEDPLSSLLKENINQITESKKIQYSKALSRILRHAADEMGLVISNKGYIRLDDILRLKPFSHDSNALAHIALVVYENGKQRFKLAYDDKYNIYIRANQGHSLVGIDPELQKITNISQVSNAIHGTYYEAWKLIKSCGYLSTMGRQQIHFAKGFTGQDGVISGMRGNAEVLLYLNIERVLKDGIELWESSNGVLLTPGVGNTRRLPLQYIESVVDKKTGKKLSMD